MTSSFSVNKGLEEPASGDYVNAWATPVNANWTAIDTALGGTTSISVTGVLTPTTTLTLTQYRPPNIEFTGVLTGNLNYQLPTGVGGMWSVSNTTSGAFTLAFSIAAGNAIVLGGGRTLIISDGTSIALAGGTTALWPLLTPEESAAGVTPTTFAYPPGNPWRYGADGTGGSNDTNALNAALAVYAQSGTGTKPFRNGFADGLYLLTEAESALGILPVNYAFPPMHVDRYGNNVTGGTTPMAAAVQAAIDVAMNTPGGGTVTYAGWYRLEIPIDCTWDANGGAPPIIIRNDGGSSHNPNSNANPSGFTLSHTGIGFDCTGNDTITFIDPVITTPVPTSTVPKLGILLARNSTKGTLINRIVRPKIVGYFSVACVYNYGSENSYLDAAYLANYNPAANTASYIITGNNIRGITSTFATIATGPLSCIVHDIMAPAFVNVGGGANSDCLVIEQSDGVHVFGGWMACTSRSLIYSDQTNAPSNFCEFINLQAENSTPAPSYGICFGAASSLMTPSGWRVRDCRLITSKFAIASIDTNTHLDGAIIDGITELTSKGISFPGVVQGGSKFFTGGTLVTIGTLNAGCVLLGASSAWTVTNANGLLLDIATVAPSGFGTPTGNAILANFPGGSATLPQCSAAISELYTILKARGWIVS